MTIVVIAAIAVVAAVVDAAWALWRGDYDDLFVLAVALVIWLALGASAWRRTRFRTASRLRAM